MNKNLLSIISVFFIIALLSTVSAIPTVTLGPSASGGGLLSGAIVIINQTGNFTYNTINNFQ